MCNEIVQQDSEETQKNTSYKNISKDLYVKVTVFLKKKDSTSMPSNLLGISPFHGSLGSVMGSVGQTVWQNLTALS